jgi:hypothetical protein
MEANGTENLLRSLLQMSCGEDIGGSARRRAAAFKSSAAASRRVLIGFLRAASPAMDEAPFASDSLGKLAENSSVVVEVATSDRKDINPQTSKVPQARPERPKVKSLITRRVGEDRHEVPVAVRTVRLSRAATEQPDFFRLKHLEYAVHNAIGEHGRRHERNCSGNPRSRQTDAHALTQSSSIGATANATPRPSLVPPASQRLGGGSSAKPTAPSIPHTKPSRARLQSSVTTHPAPAVASQPALRPVSTTQ